MKDYVVGSRDPHTHTFHVLGIGKGDVTRRAAQIHADRWVAHGYPRARVYVVKEARWTPRDLYNQVVVWLSWVRS